IYECSYMCKCSKDCPNRAIQRGSNLKLTIFRTTRKGWGVCTEQPIRRGQYICRYTGELLTFQESDTRNTSDMTYLFDLDKEVPIGEQPEYTIDARRYGNVSRFFNHSCDPNLTAFAAYVTHLNPMMTELAFFANCDIMPGKELTFDY
ncbi:SET domain-containing protein, partial [Linderina pennispora]